MENLKLILHDGTEVHIDEFTLPLHVVVQCESKENAQSVWDSLTPEQLAEVSIQIDGNTALVFRDVTLSSMQCINGVYGEVTAHFFMNAGSVVPPESEYAAACRILLGEEE